MRNGPVRRWHACHSTLAAALAREEHDKRVGTDNVRGGTTVKTAQPGYVATEPRPAGLVTEHRSMGWLVVAVVVAILAILVMGTMAEDRWCGAELCVEEAARL